MIINKEFGIVILEDKGKTLVFIRDETEKKFGSCSRCDIASWVSRCPELHAGYLLCWGEHRAYPLKRIKRFLLLNE